MEEARNFVASLIVILVLVVCLVLMFYLVHDLAFIIKNWWTNRKPSVRCIYCYRERSGFQGQNVHQFVELIHTDGWRYVHNSWYCPTCYVVILNARLAASNEHPVHMLNGKWWYWVNAPAKNCVCVTNRHATARYRVGPYDTLHAAYADFIAYCGTLEHNKPMQS